MRRSGWTPVLAIAAALGCSAPASNGSGAQASSRSGSATDSPALRDAAERARRLAEAEQTIENDPLVRALMSQYKTARIVPGSVKSL